LGLTARVRERLARLQRETSGTGLGQEVSALAADTSQLCDHIERLHGEAHRLIAEYRALTLEVESAGLDVETEEMQRTAIEIQRDQHRKSASTMEFIKAMFMWVDTPEERLRAQHSQSDEAPKDHSSKRP